MKLKLITGLILAALIALTPGCSTTGNKPIDAVTAEKLAPILSGSVAGAVVYAYQKNPKTEVIVDTVAVALEQFLLSTNLSPAALQATLYNLPVAELKTPEAQLVIAPLLAIYQGFADKQVKEKINNDPGLKLLIQSMVDGLKQGKAAIQQMKSSPPSAAIDNDLDSLRTVMNALQERMQNEIRRLESRSYALVR